MEILLCACGGERRIIAAIDEGPVARKILRQQPLAVSDLGLPSGVPSVAPARIDQDELWQMGPPGHLDDRAAPAPDGELLRAGSQWLPRTSATTSTQPDRSPPFIQRDHLDALTDLLLTSAPASAPDRYRPALPAHDERRLAPAARGVPRWVMAVGSYVAYPLPLSFTSFFDSMPIPTLS